MNGERQTTRTWLAGLCGAAMLVGTPLLAQADDGKWWNPQERPAQREKRIERTQRTVRARDNDRLRVTRQARPRFQRDIVVLRHGARGKQFRAHRVWTRPFYLERQRICVIRPVRYFSGITATLGSVQIHARFDEHDGWYGCNFCDARFGSYRGYRQHVHRCDDRPRGYHFDVQDWDDDWYGDAFGRGH